jgi:hypothetical protein
MTRQYHLAIICYWPFIFVDGFPFLVVSCHYHLRNSPTCMPSQAAEHSSPAICDKTFASHRPSCQPFSATRRVRSQKVGDQKKRGEFEPQPSQNIWKRCFFSQMGFEFRDSMLEQGKTTRSIADFWWTTSICIYVYIYMYTYIYVYICENDITCMINIALKVYV